MLRRPGWWGTRVPCRGWLGVCRRGDWSSVHFLCDSVCEVVAVNVAGPVLVQYGLDLLGSLGAGRRFGERGGQDFAHLVRTQVPDSCRGCYLRAAPDHLVGDRFRGEGAGLGGEGTLLPLPSRRLPVVCTSPRLVPLVRDLFEGTLGLACVVCLIVDLFVASADDGFQVGNVSDECFPVLFLVVHVIGSCIRVHAV